MKDAVGLVLNDRHTIFFTKIAKWQDAKAAEMSMLAKIDTYVATTTGWPTVVEQIERGMIVLELYDVALTQKQVVNKALTLLEHTGDALRKDVEKYKRKPSVEQSWEDIKTSLLQNLELTAPTYQFL